MFPRRLALSLTVALAIGLGSAPADAQSAADKATARSLATEAQRAYDAKDYESAADKFGRANELYPAPTLLLGLARAEAARGKLVIASEHYTEVVRTGADADAPSAFKQAVVDAKAELEKLKPRIPGVVVNVIGPPEPTVTLNGQSLPAAALGVRRPVDPGDHKIVASADGWAAEERSFNATEGNVATVDITLTEDADATVVGPVASPTEGEQKDDGSGAGQSSGGSGGWMTPVGVTALVVGGVGLVVGGVFGALAITTRSSLVEDCDGDFCPGSSSGELDEFRTFGTVSTVGFIAGAVLAAGGVTLLILAPSDSGSARAPFVSPYLGVAEAGVVGRF